MSLLSCLIVALISLCGWGFTVFNQYLCFKASSETCRWACRHEITLVCFDHRYFIRAILYSGHFAIWLHFSTKLNPPTWTSKTHVSSPLHQKPPRLDLVEQNQFAHSQRCPIATPRMLPDLCSRWNAEEKFKEFTRHIDIFVFELIFLFGQLADIKTAASLQ